MQIHQLQPKTSRIYAKRIGRGGKRGTTSGKGTKGQKSRAGAGVRPGFRGGDNRAWQLFPKRRGASKKPGNARPHRKHKFFRLIRGKPFAINVSDLNIFSNGQAVSVKDLFDNGLIPSLKQEVKILGDGILNKKINLSGMRVSKSAADKIAKAGGNITPINADNPNR